MSPSEPPVTPVPSNNRRTNFVAAEEAKRRLTTAYIALKRGNTEQAERAAKEILLDFPEDAAAWEMLGDVRMARADFEGALEAMRTSLLIEPGRVGAANKQAQLTLQLSEEQRRAATGHAYASESRSLLHAGNGDNVRRRGIIFSALLPGSGQIMNGEFVKGGVFLAVFALAIAALFLAGVQPPLSVPAYIALFVLLIDWVAAMIDAGRF